MSVRRLQPLPSRGWLTCRLAAICLLASATVALACPLCYEAARQQVTIGQQLDMSDRIVLAAPVPGANQFRIIEIVKGRDSVGDVIEDPVMGLEVTAPDPGASLLLRDRLAPQRTKLGTIRPD